MEFCEYCGDPIPENGGVKSYTSLLTSSHIFCCQRCYEKSGIAARDAEIKKKYDNFVKGWIAFSERKSILAFIPRILWFVAESFILGGIVFLIELVIGAVLENSSAAMDGIGIQFLLGWLRFVLRFAESGLKGILLLIFVPATVEGIVFHFIGRRAAVFGQNCCLILIVIGTIVGKML